MSSSDGFCSSLTFAVGELGEKYTGPLVTQTRHHHTPSTINTAASQSQSSNHSTPTPTPTTSSIPISSTATASSQKQPSAGFPASPSSFIPARPGSPARSNSVSSIATSSSFAQGPGDQSNMNAPTPAMSSIPGIAATNSGPVGVMPMWTPPLTPAHGHGGTHSASSSVSGIPGVGVGRRESESEREDGVPVSRKRDLHAVLEVEETREGKRRRITPTPVSIGGSVDGGESAITSTEETTPTAQTPTQP